jgi:hypothetical protein
VSFTDFGLRPVDGINAAILLVVVWILIRVIHSDANSIVWADFISTRGADGKQHGDTNKGGQLVGIVISAITVLMYADNQTVDVVGLAALLGVALAFLAAPTMYAGFLRSKQGTTQTVVEPVANPGPTKSTTTETP